jgi:hypothetical protein
MPTAVFVVLLVAFFLQLVAIELQGQVTGLALFTSIAAKVAFAVALFLWALTPVVVA